jgi:hypothetical protein
MRIVLVLSLVACAGCGSGGLPGTAVTDAAVDAPPLDSAAVDAPVSADGPPVGVPCGEQFCDTSGGLVCCEGFPLACQKPPCGPGIQTDGCDGPEDCGGGLHCCLLISPFFGTTCVADCSQAGNQRGTICHTDADCAANEQCLQLEVSGGLRGCYPR